MTDSRPTCALTIAGSDSGGGAGIQADLKTFAAHGVHGLCAIAALTAQHTRGVAAVEVPSPAFLRAQVDACFDDFRIGAVKLGMLANAGVIHAVADALEHHRPPAVVLDPVMVATSGARLLEPEALAALRERLLPLATILTPNLPEAGILLERPLRTLQDMREAGAEAATRFGCALLLKGGHATEEGTGVTDLLFVDGVQVEIHHERLALEAHGTGCTLASAIAANLCRGAGLEQACRDAADYVHAALRSGYRAGRSELVLLDHFGAARP